MAPTALLSLLAACDPHDAEVSTSYAMYLGAATSTNIIKAQASAESANCVFDDASEDLFADDCYIEQQDAERVFTDEYGLVPLDCRDLSDKTRQEVRDARLRNFDYEANCCIESLDDDTTNDPDGNQLTAEGDCTNVEPIFFDFLDDYAYYLMQGTAESGDTATYREEVVLTSEGDLQMTVHTTTAFGDFRFGWVIDPLFQPTICVEDENGEAFLQNVHGDWVEGWSSNPDSEGWTTYHLNSSAQQINPFKADDPWYFDDTWAGGVAFARMEGEDYYTWTTDYTDYYGASAEYPYGVPLWVAADSDGAVYGGYYPGVGTYEKLDCKANCDSFSTYADFYDTIHKNFIEGGTSGEDVVRPIQDELERYGLVSREDVPVTFQIEDNSWRIENDDGAAQGLAGWVGVSPSFVRFDSGIDLTTLRTGKQDTPIKGEFQIYMASLATSSKLVLGGSFTISNIAEDVWGRSPTLMDQKRAENATPECGE